MSMTRPRSVLLLLGSGAANWVVFYWGGLLFEGKMPGFTASLLLASVLVHEACHALVMEMAGVRTYIVFAVVGGGTVPWSADEGRYDRLPWGWTSMVSLSGMFGNFLVIIAALAGFLNGWITHDQLDYAVNLNATLVLFNLLPFGIFDGGKFARNLFNSLPDGEGLRFAAAMGISILLCAAAIKYFLPESYTLTATLFAWGLLTRRHPVKRSGHNHLAMNEQEAVGFGLMYLGLVGLAMLLASSTHG